MKTKTIYNVAFVLSALCLVSCVDDTKSRNSKASTSTNETQCADGSTCENGFCSDNTACDTPSQGTIIRDSDDDDRDAILASCRFADTRTSHDHCGYCGNKCGQSEGCINGTCTICNGTIDYDTDSGNCGFCGNDCGAHAACQAGKCVCAGDYSDCDDDGICETAASVCPCRPGDSKTCYTGPSNTVDKTGKPLGNCKTGTTYCQFDAHGGYFWDDNDCEGEVTPSYDYTCATDTDDVDCNGVVDVSQDADGDGYYVYARGLLAADCCDSAEHCNTALPHLVHPGQQHDCYGNHLDDNCSGKIDDEPDISCSEYDDGSTAVAECYFERTSCSTTDDYAYPSNSSSPLYYPNCSTDYVESDLAYTLIRAFDLCMDKVTVESNQAGIIEATLTSSTDTTASSTAKVGARQIHVMDAMRDLQNEALITPRNGDTFLLLSSGAADDVAGSVTTNDECFATSMKSLPSIYATAHDNKMETNPSCTQTKAQVMNDPVHLHIKMRAPQLARCFSFDFRFFTREYPHYICTNFNDFFLALLTDENGNAIGRIKDGNISFDKEGNPISVNNAFFTTCGPASCSGFSKGDDTKGGCPTIMTCTADNVCGFVNKDQSVSICPNGSDELAAYYPKYFTSGTAATANGRGGATAWLTTTAPIKGGQIFNLDFYIWDTGDKIYDSSILLDNFQWTCNDTTVSTGFAPPIEEIL